MNNYSVIHFDPMSIDPINLGYRYITENLGTT